MKKKLIALALIIIVALAAMEGLYLLLRRAHEARQTSAESVVVTRDNISIIAPVENHRFNNLEFTNLVFDIETPERPQGNGEQRFEDLTPDEQATYRRENARVHDEMYARRFNLSIEEWKALSPKEQRHLIRKGKVK